MDLLCFFCLVFAMPFCPSVYLCFVVNPDRLHVISKELAQTCYGCEGDS